MYLGGYEDVLGFAQYLPTALAARSADMPLAFLDFRHAKAERYAYCTSFASVYDGESDLDLVILQWPPRLF